MFIFFMSQATVGGHTDEEESLKQGNQMTANTCLHLYPQHCNNSTSKSSTEKVSVELTHSILLDGTRLSFPHLKFGDS